MKTLHLGEEVPVAENGMENVNTLLPELRNENAQGCKSWALALTIFGPFRSIFPSAHMLCSQYYQRSVVFENVH